MHPGDERSPMARRGFVSRPRAVVLFAVLACASASAMPSAAVAYKVPKTCIVPNVVGKSVSSAERSINRAHCQVGTVTTQTSPVAKNRVLSQDPAVGSAGPTVNLVISTGPPPKGCMVPEVIGKSLSAAVRTIAAARCQIGNVTFQDSILRRGEVISQDPAAGSPGPSVNLVISTGVRPPTCRVPDVVGKRLARAKRKLVQAHCSVGKITHRFSFRRRGRVLSERPHRGARLPQGTKVDLTVSAGRRGRHHGRQQHGHR